MKRIGAAEGAQIVHQRYEVGVAHRRAVEIDDRQRETHPLRERAQRAHVDERRDPRRRAAENLALGDGKTLAEFGQCVAADERPDEKAVGLQRAADLDERPGQIVDGLQHEERHREVETSVGRRQALDIPDRAEEFSGAEAGEGRCDPDGAVDLSARRERCGGVRPGGAEIGRQSEAPLDQRQALGQLPRPCGEARNPRRRRAAPAPRRDRAGD